MNKYIKIGIYDKGDVIIGMENEDAFLTDCTYDIALIKKVKGSSLGTLGFGTEVYPVEEVDCDIKSIFTVDAWKIIIENNLIDSISGDTFIQWLVSQKRKVPEELLDYIKSVRPSDSIDSLLIDAKTLHSAKWLYKNGASLEPEDYSCTVKEYWSMWQDKDHVEMYDYFFGENGIVK